MYDIWRKKLRSSHEGGVLCDEFQTSGLTDWLSHTLLNFRLRACRWQPDQTYRWTNVSSLLHASHISDVVWPISCARTSLLKQTLPGGGSVILRQTASKVRSLYFGNDAWPSAVFGS